MTSHTYHNKSHANELSLTRGGRLQPNNTVPIHTQNKKKERKKAVLYVSSWAPNLI